MDCEQFYKMNMKWISEPTRENIEEFKELVKRNIKRLYNKPLNHEAINIIRIRLSVLLSSIEFAETDFLKKFHIYGIPNEFGIGESIPDLNYDSDEDEFLYHSAEQYAHRKNDRILRKFLIASRFIDHKIKMFLKAVQLIKPFEMEG